MKKYALLLSMLATTAFAHAPLHLDLEMTSAEYAVLLKETSQNKKFEPKADDPVISSTIKLGTRLSKWVALVNTNRPVESAIRLTSASTRPKYPIDKPNAYSPSIIQKKLQETLNATPASMKEVLLGNGDLPTSIGMDDETFILHARNIDRNYQMAARYKTLDMYRNEYIDAAARDVRGYYYLTQKEIGAAELSDVTKIPAETLPAIKDALLQVCRNSFNPEKECSRELGRAVKNNRLSAFYSKYIESGKTIWDSFFLIPGDGRRQDIQWTGNRAIVPFNTPEIPKFGPYLQNNIEDEFKWGTWSLKLAFGTFENGPRLKFEPGVVPHVNALGGNEIVMDSNQPIEEYESQWTIRHEFGHVLGLPDCYHEFYDVNARAYVQYQLDTTDLMCSRSGNMNERIYLELKKAYAP